MWKTLLILSTVLLSLGWFAIPVNGATVTITKTVIINTQFGRLTVLSPQMVFNTFTVYANGTVYFDAQGNERNQNAYIFTGQSYGNGTFDIRFKLASLPTRIVSLGSATTSIGYLTRITYTASETNMLELVRARLSAAAEHHHQQWTGNGEHMVCANLCRSWNTLHNRHDQPASRDNSEA